MNILLADDNVEFLHLIKSALMLNGYTVYAVEDGNEACKLLEAVDVDLIMSDIKMPTLDGIMLHAHARELPRYKETKFIFISGYMEIYSDILFLNPKLDFFLEKSTPISEMISFVEELTFGDLSGTISKEQV